MWCNVMSNTTKCQMSNAQYVIPTEVDESTTLEMTDGLTRGDFRHTIVS